MSKAVVGLLAGGAATVVVGAGGFLAYNQLSQPNNSNTNSNVVATSSNTTSTKSIKSELFGTWVQTFKTDDPDNPKNKIEFTADEVITHTEVVSYTDEEVPQKKKHIEIEKGKYKILCGQFLELKDGKSEAVSIGKFTIEGDELTIAGRTKDLDKKYKRESRNTAANTSTDTADSNTEEVALNQKDLLGTWIDTEKPEFKYVFTEDKMSASRNDQQMDEGKYKLPCGQVLESTDERGHILFSKVTIEGSEMTIYRNGEKYKLKRESANGDQAVAAADAEKSKVNDRIAQEQTTKDIRYIEGALLMWITDNASPDGPLKVASVDMKNFVRISYEDLKKELHPSDTFFYIKDIPEKDGWGHPYEFYLVRKFPGRKNVMANYMAIRSPGRDGKYQDSTVYQVKSFPAENFDEDMVWVDGYFVRWAEKQP